MYHEYFEFHEFLEQREFKGINCPFTKNRNGQTVPLPFCGNGVGDLEKFIKTNVSG